jgi:folylpolyglutamate synthase/dihydropteroate synthase
LVDKDCDEILDVLREVLSPIVLFASSGERSWTADRVAVRHRDLNFAPNFSAALKHLAPTDKTTVICGSVHAVGEVMRDLKIALT